MKKVEKLEKVAQARDHYAAQAAKGSTGSDMSLCETIVRDMLQARGTGDLYARKLGQADVRVRTAEGECLTVEVKHGAGAIAYAEINGQAVFTTRSPELCLKGVDYVVYARYARPDARRTEMAMDYMVSTREDFLDMLVEYCHGPRGAGFETATKFSKEGKQINIQSAYVDRLWEGMQDDDRAMCLWDFCTEVLGRDPRWDW